LTFDPDFYYDDFAKNVILGNPGSEKGKYQKGDPPWESKPYSLGLVFSFLYTLPKVPKVKANSDQFINQSMTTQRKVVTRWLNQ
jgi:hypothetical protein